MVASPRNHFVIHKAGILDSGLFFWYAAHVRQLGGVSPLHNLIEVK